MRIRSVTASLLIASFVFALGAPTFACAQAWPLRPVRFIVPFAPGGANDIAARLLARPLTERWGQTVIVENRAGAAGNIAAVDAAKAAPDGYTLFFTAGAVVTANEFIYPNLGFIPVKDFVGVTGVARGPQLIVVPVDSPYRTVQELIVAAKSRPGVLTFGHAGVGSQTHLAAENFLLAAGIDAQNIPYKGEGPALTDLLSGQLSFVTPNIAAAINFVTQGKLRALAVTSKVRSVQLPEVPAAAEALPGFENTGWFGLVAPSTTPRTILEKVATDTAEALDSAGMRARFYVQGMQVMTETLAAMDQMMAAERRLWSRVVRERKIAVR